jgi:hypothetical protein
MIQKLKCLLDDSRNDEIFEGYFHHTPYLEIVKSFRSPEKFLEALLGIILFLSFGLNAHAQNNNQNQPLLYHIIATDSTSRALQNQTVALRISIMQGNASNPIIYSEIFTANSDSSGVASFTFGSGQVVSGNLSYINWSASNLARLEVDPKAGRNFSRIGTAPIITAIPMLIPNQP